MMYIEHLDVLVELAWTAPGCSQNTEKQRIAHAFAAVLPLGKGKRSALFGVRVLQLSAWTNRFAQYALHNSGNSPAHVWVS